MLEALIEALEMTLINSLWKKPYRVKSNKQILSPNVKVTCFIHVSNNLYI